MLQKSKKVQIQGFLKAQYLSSVPELPEDLHEQKKRNLGTRWIIIRHVFSCKRFCELRADFCLSHDYCITRKHHGS